MVNITESPDLGADDCAVINKKTLVISNCIGKIQPTRTKSIQMQANLLNDQLIYYACVYITHC